MVPIFLAAAGGVLVGGAVIYYFVSNNAKAKRNEFTGKIEALLEALSKKAETLKKAKEAAEASYSAAKSDTDEMRGYCDWLERELAQTLKERDNVAGELQRWQESDGSIASGIAVIGLSKVLLNANFDHGAAIKNLESQTQRVRVATLSLENERGTHSWLNVAIT